MPEPKNYLDILRGYAGVLCIAAVKIAAQASATVSHRVMHCLHIYPAHVDYPVHAAEVHMHRTQSQANKASPHRSGDRRTLFEFLPRCFRHNSDCLNAEHTGELDIGREALHEHIYHTVSAWGRCDQGADKLHDVWSGVETELLYKESLRCEFEQQGRRAECPE